MKTTRVDLTLDLRLTLTHISQEENHGKSNLGCVNKDASIHSGTGFTVDHLSTGLFLITYKTPFDVTPAVVVTQNYPGWEEFGSSGGNTMDNAVLVASDEIKFKVKTGDGGGGASDRNFAFISTALSA